MTCPKCGGSMYQDKDALEHGFSIWFAEDVETDYLMIKV